MIIYNTLTRKLEEFAPVKKNHAGIYTCGPTVYNYAHLGNLRTYIFEDVLKRVLYLNGYKVKHIMNITDVGHLTSDADEGEDKIEKGAAREGKTAWEIADFYTDAFKKDLSELNILPPDIYCRATDHIKEQINLVKKLEKNGFTYKTTDGIYFDTSRLPDYGKLAGSGKRELKAGARVDLGEKKNITDFALWKFSPANKKRQMEWPSPWGTGFPGWHLECSAMSVKYLGQPFDIHCGGIDHIPVHHTNEIAQSEAANGKPLANYWLHGEFLITGAEKMAKSAGNFLTLASVKENNISPLAYRYFVLQTHYRKQLNFSWDALSAAQNGLNHLCRLLPDLPDKGENKNLSEKFSESINNDLDIPAALAIVWQAVRERKISRKQLFKFDEVFGLRLAEFKEEKIELSDEAKELVRARNEARAQKQWSQSDALRKQLEEMGFVVEDTKEGTKITKK
jgi:cysteinyl-tRNA synthetase